MPYYDFCCEDCGHHFEEYFSVDSDRSNLKCPECSSEKVRRNFGNISIGHTKVACADCSSDSCDFCTGHSSNN